MTHSPESGIGGSLRAARERRGWTREELAHRAGVSYGAIAQIESGRRRDVRLSSIVALADALEVSIDHLLARSPTAAKPLLEHRALPYGSDDDLVEVLLPFLAEGADRNERLLAVTTVANIALLRAALGAAAKRVVFHDADDWYSSPTAALERYRSFVHDSVDRGHRWVRVVGEPVWEGRTAAEAAAWTRYEALINVTLASAAATIVCPYDTRRVAGAIIDAAKRTHPECLEDAEAFLLEVDAAD